MRGCASPAAAAASTTASILAAICPGEGGGRVCLADGLPDELDVGQHGGHVRRVDDDDRVAELAHAGDVIGLA